MPHYFFDTQVLRCYYTAIRLPVFSIAHHVKDQSMQLYFTVLGIRLTSIVFWFELLTGTRVEVRVGVTSRVLGVKSACITQVAFEDCLI